MYNDMSSMDMTIWALMPVAVYTSNNSSAMDT